MINFSEQSIDEQQWLRGASSLFVNLETKNTGMIWSKSHVPGKPFFPSIKSPVYFRAKDNYCLINNYLMWLKTDKEEVYLRQILLLPSPPLPPPKPTTKKLQEDEMKLINPHTCQTDCAVVQLVHTTLPSCGSTAALQNVRWTSLTSLRFRAAILMFLTKKYRHQMLPFKCIY